MNAFTKPSPLKAAILQIFLIPMMEARVMVIKIWLIPNLVALCHTVGKDKLNRPYDVLSVHIFGYSIQTSIFGDVTPCK
jgi:hypothetical protein